MTKDLLFGGVLLSWTRMKHENMQEMDLVKRAVAGDARAFRDLLDLHYGTVFRMAFRFCGNKHDAEDVTQMACLKMAQNIGNFRAESAFTTWLYSLVLNTARDWLRTKNRQTRGSVGIEAADDVDSGAVNPEQSLEIQQKMDKVRALPEPEREIVWLVFGEGLSHKQVAEIMGVAEGTISWRISEARKILKQGGVL